MKKRLKRNAEGKIVEFESDLLDRVKNGLKVAIDEITTRISEIKKLISSLGDDELTEEQITDLEEEFDVLDQRMTTLKNNQESKENFRKKVADYIGINTRSLGSGETGTKQIKPETEYRTAWLKQIRDIQLNDIEKRALTTLSSSDAVIPTETANAIICAIKEKCNFLNEITVTYINGAVQYAVAGDDDDAIHHSEGANITANQANTTKINLTGYEIIKLIEISGSVKQMSITAFETWLVENISNAIVRTINKDIILGTGTNQPKGIEKANTWNATNSITVAKDVAITANNVFDVVGLLDSNFDENAKFIMKKRTLFTSFLPLQDKSKNELVTREGKDYYILGYPVLFNESVKADEAYFGDLTKVYGNLAENFNIKTAYDIKTNNYQYSGIAMFDCKPATGKAFVKIVKATA